MGKKPVIGLIGVAWAGIALAGFNRPARPGEDDGMLTAFEAQQLDLSGVELVVLSACETSLGREARAEWMLGVQRAFQIAGARASVSTARRCWACASKAGSLAKASRVLGSFCSNVRR